jgi:hypothetical protein
MLEEKLKVVEGAANHFAQVAALQAELDAKSAEIVGLQDELRQAKNDGTGTQGQIVDLQARLKRCEDSLTATTGARNVARQNLVGLEAALEKAKVDKEKAIAGLRSARDAAEEEAARTHAARESEFEAQLVKAKGDKEKAIAGLRAARATEAATMRASVEAAEAAVARADAAVAAKEAELATARADAEAARGETATAESERNTIAAALGESIQEKEDVAAQLASITDRLAQIEATANQRAQTLTTTQAALDAANQQISELQNQLAETRAALASKTTSNEDGTAANEALRKQVEDLTVQLAAKDAEKQGLQGRMDELIATTSQQLEELRAQLSGLEASVQEKDTTIAEKERELAECRESLRELEVALVEANRRLETAQETIQEHEARIQSLEEALRKCEADSATAAAAAEAEKVSVLADKNAETATALAAKNADTATALAAKNRNTAAAFASKDAELASSLASKNTELASSLASKNTEQQAKNAAANVAKEALAKEIESLKEQLRLAQAAAEQARRNAEASAAKETGEKDTLTQQLAEANASVAALENLLTQKNTGSKQAFDEAMAAAGAAQSTAIQAMQNEKDAEKEASLKVEREECAKKIGDMNERLRLLEQEKATELAAKNTNLQAKQAELNTTRNAGAAATAASAQAAQEADQRAQEALTAKDKEIADTKAALEAAQAKQAGVDAKLKECDEHAKRVTEQTAQLTAKDAALAVKEAELTQKQTALEAAEASSAAAQTAAQAAQTELATTKTQGAGKNVRINSLSRNLQAAQGALATAKAAATPEGAFQITQERLMNLLSYLIVDEDARQQAQDYLSMKGDKIPDTVTKQKEMMCNFFKYLYDVVKVQMNDFRTLKLFPDAVKGKQTHLDIFQIFISSNLNGSHSPPFTKQQMLTDLTNIFQYFFITSQGGELSRKAIPGSYTTLQKLFNVLITKEGGPLDPMVQSEKVLLLLNKFGPLSDISLESIGNNSFYFVEKNVEAFRRQGADPKLQAAPEGRCIPLIILAIKMVQLLYDEVTVTYRKMDSFCGFLKPGPAAVVQQEAVVAAAVKGVDVEKEAIEKARAVSLPTIAREITTYTGIVNDPPMGKDPLYYRTYLSELLTMAIEHQKLTKLIIENLIKIKKLDVKQFIRAKITTFLQTKPSTFLSDTYAPELVKEINRFLKSTL